MNKATILNLLHRHRDDFTRRFGARYLALFGSAARDELHDDSDVDILVEFEGPGTFDGYMDLKFFLESLLGRQVDLRLPKRGCARRFVPTSSARPSVSRDWRMYLRDMRLLRPHRFVFDRPARKPSSGTT